MIQPSKIDLPHCFRFWRPRYTVRLYREVLLAGDARRKYRGLHPRAGLLYTADRGKHRLCSQVAYQCCCCYYCRCLLLVGVLYRHCCCCKVVYVVWTMNEV